MSLNYEIEPITEENLYDFQRLILPDILPELMGIPDNSISGAVLCGARLDGQPCGAAVCSLAGNELFIASIYVVSPLRRNGIGSGLLEYACALALGESDITNGYQQLQINCEYNLPRPDAVEFKAFLKSAGFNNFIEDYPVYSVQPQHFDGLAVTAVTEFEKEARDELLAINENADMVIVPELSFAEKDVRNSRQFMYTQDLGNNTYLVSTSTEIDTSEEEYEAFVRAALSRISDYDPDAAVLLRADETPYTTVWDRLAEECGTICTHVRATAYRVYNYE